MTTIPTMSPPESLGAAIAPIAALSEDEFQKLYISTSSPRSFGLKSKDVKNLSGELPALGTNLPFALGALTYLYSRLESHRDKAPLREIVRKIIEDFEVECSPSEADVLQERLTLLLETNPHFSNFKKAQRLEKGFLPNAVRFKSLVDLRPDFGGGENLSFGGLLKIVQFRITTDSDDENEKEFVFQLNEEALAEFRKAIDRAEAKLRLISQVPDLSSHLINNE